MPWPNDESYEERRAELVERISRLRVAATCDGDREVREALEAALAALRTLDDKRTER